MTPSQSQSQSQSKTALLLLNVGTPDAPTEQAVGRYLKRFLMDKWVLDIPWLWRWLLVNLVIVPRRRGLSAHAYKSIWTERGSPLLFHSQDLLAALREKLGPLGLYDVELGMCLGRPGIDAAFAKFKADQISKVIAFPLFPQYAESTTRSALEAVTKAALKCGFAGEIITAQPFFDAPAFVDSYAEIAHRYWQRGTYQHVLFSFHGLPVRHLRRLDQDCLRSAVCCERLAATAGNCYRAQCFASARAIAARLGLAPGMYSIAFQSRLGRGEWIRPYTDEVLSRLGASGLDGLLVLCPSFTADCLETVEEIGMRGAEVFTRAGGKHISVAPCLNAEPAWVERLTAYIVSFARRERAL